jgi:Transposase and inactivated derivatives
MLNIKLEDNEVNFLIDFVRTGHKSAREITRARVLLLSNQQKMGTEITKILGISRNTVLLIKKRYVKEGLPSALFDKPRPGQPIKYTEKHIAEVIALACSSSPDGSKRWSLSLLTEELRKKEGFETINKESIRLILKKVKLSPG